MSTVEQRLRAWGPEPAEGDFVTRQSTVSNMDLCGGRNGLPLQHNLPDAPPSEAMFSGTSIHLVVDHLIDNTMGIASPWDLSHDVFGDELQVLAQEKDNFRLRPCFSSQGVWNGWVDHILDMGHKWLEQWGIPNWATIEQAIVREDKLYRPLGIVYDYSTTKSTRCWVSGHPDLATADMIVDWKTSSRNWQKGKAQGAVQDDIYAALVEWNFPNVTINQGLFVVGDRGKGTWHEHPTLITQASKEAALDRALAHARDLLLGTWNLTPNDNFGKRGWHCKPQFCGAWNVCTARKLGDEFENVAMVTRTDWM